MFTASPLWSWESLWGELSLNGLNPEWTVGGLYPKENLFFSTVIGTFWHVGGKRQVVRFCDWWVSTAHVEVSINAPKPQSLGEVVKTSAALWLKQWAHSHILNSIHKDMAERNDLPMAENKFYCQDHSWSFFLNLTSCRWKKCTVFKSHQKQWQIHFLESLNHRYKYHIFKVLYIWKDSATYICPFMPPNTKYLVSSELTYAKV